MWMFIILLNSLEEIRMFDFFFVILMKQLCSILNMKLNKKIIKMLLESIYKVLKVKLGMILLYIICENIGVVMVNKLISSDVINIL